MGDQTWGAPSVVHTPKVYNTPPPHLSVVDSNGSTSLIVEHEGYMIVGRPPLRALAREAWKRVRGR
jgi:hypothetical protein